MKFPVIPVSQSSVGLHGIEEKAFDSGERPGRAERALLSDKLEFVRQRYNSLYSDEDKNPRRRISDRSLQNSPIQLPRAGLFPLQYYNRRAPKKSPPNGLERTVADIGTEAFYPVVYCGRNKRKRL